MYDGIGRSLGTDYFRIADQLTERGARATCGAPASSSTTRCCRSSTTTGSAPSSRGRWCEKLGKLGIVGDGIEGYGCPPMSPIASGLIHMELNRGDGSLGTFVGVQAGLAMQSIAMLGSEEQKQRWLPAHGPAGRSIGAFALTEPAHGSDSVALETSARRDGDGWVINGDEEVDRQRHDRRRRRGVGPRRRGQPGQGVPGREGHPGLPGDAGSRARARCARSGRPRSR